MSGPLPLPSLRDRRSPVRPHSRILTRGAIGSLRKLDGRSPEGRLVRRLEGELLAHLGHEPSVAERLLVDQIVKLRLLLDALGERMMEGTFTDLDRRCFGSAHNALRLALREIGLKPAPSGNRPADLETYLASLRAADGEAGEVSAKEPAPEQRPVRRRPAEQQMSENKPPTG